MENGYTNNQSEPNGGSSENSTKEQLEMMNDCFDGVQYDYIVVVPLNERQAVSRARLIARSLRLHGYSGV